MKQLFPAKKKSNMQFSITPDFPGFETNFTHNIPQVVSKILIADLETPVSAMLKLQKEEAPCFLLESVQGGENLGRYSIIGLNPDLLWRCKGNKAEVCDLKAGTDFIPSSEASLVSLKKLLKSCVMEIAEDMPPMAAGLIGYMGFDMVKLMEKLPDTNPDPINIPDGYFMRPQIMIIFDAVKGVMHLITPVWECKGDAETAYRQAVSLIEKVETTLNTPLSKKQEPAASQPLEFTPHITPEAYHAMVEKAKTYIEAGDIFQVVPSQRFSTPFTASPFSLYRSLRHLNPSPFLFYLHFDNFSLIGSSPEILVRLRDEKVTIRPIAGTRKRGKNRQEDATLAADLLADPKEISEHLMLLDLGRNDVGRVARAGSVSVTEQMTVEYYSHVMHLVSNVEGIIDPRYDAIDALIAGFPAGTVSGAPKIRAMEIIDELESERRSFYGGCVGYFSANGSMDTCITLRTSLIKDGVLYAQAGGGVVADSDPEAEYQESCNKARAIMKAAAEAWRFA